MDCVYVIEASEVKAAVAELYCRINLDLREDVLDALRRAREREEADPARSALDALLANAALAAERRIPLCQDTGLAVAFAQMGSRAVLSGGTLHEAIDAGVRAAAAETPLRASVVRAPLGRANTGDNSPAVVHVEQVEGDSLTVHLMAKGGGAENMSRVAMLTPADGREGVIGTIVETVRRAGANACPPVIVGVGLGGNLERAALLAKRALLRDLRAPNADADLAALEAEALARVNALGLGPQGFGGRTTALAVLIEQAPCHIASLPVAVNVECHSHRHGSVTLHGKKHNIEER